MLVNIVYYLFRSNIQGSTNLSLLSTNSPVYGLVRGITAFHLQESEQDPTRYSSKERSAFYVLKSNHSIGSMFNLDYRVKPFGYE